MLGSETAAIVRTPVFFLQNLDPGRDQLYWGVQAPIPPFFPFLFS